MKKFKKGKQLWNVNGEKIYAWGSQLQKLL